ncbi:hypothetical protein ACRAWD_28540 [Caulobacter segnis]
MGRVLVAPASTRPASSKRSTPCVANDELVRVAIVCRSATARAAGSGAAATEPVRRRLAWQGGPGPYVNVRVPSKCALIQTSYDRPTSAGTWSSCAAGKLGQLRRRILVPQGKVALHPERAATPGRRPFGRRLGPQPVRTRHQGEILCQKA